MKLEDKAVEAIDKILSTSESALAFITEQSPEMVSQLLAYHLADAIYGLVFGLLTIAAMINLVVMFKRKSAWVCDEYGDLNGFGLGYLVASVTLLFFGILSIIIGISTILKIYLAPNLYILEYAVGLVK